MFVHYQCHILKEWIILKRLMLNKTSESKECPIGISIFFANHYWYFLDKGLKFLPDECHNVLTMSMNLSDIAVLDINGANHHQLSLYFKYWQCWLSLYQQN